MNEQLKFYKGNEENLQAINPQAGSIYHCEDTGNTYLANENSELEIYSNTFTFSEAEADAAVPVNADTLNGKTANDFMTPIQVDDAINEAVENVAYVSNLSSDSSLVLADAESLGGLPAENYATKNYVVDTINQAQLGGDNSEVDLSIYATKDDLTLVRNAIPTTPGDIGAEVDGAANSALNSAKTYVNEQINAIDYPVDSVNGKTGAVTLSASDVGAAPSGYGLGDGGIFLSSLGLTVDTVARGGFYRWDVHEGAPFSFATMIVAPRTGNASAAQLAFCHAGANTGVMATRMYSKDANIPWEYINPPMVLGTEYRTTERYNGKPVYVKAIETGALPNNDFDQYITGVSYANIVDFYMLAKNASVNYLYKFTNDEGCFWAEAHYFVFYPKHDMSAFTGTIVFKYTK